MHRKTPENIDRLLAWLIEHGAHHRFDLAKRRLPPTREQLAGDGHLNLQLNLGKLDVLCELGPGEDNENLVADTVLVERGSLRLLVLDLHRLIAVKSRAGRPKDRAVLPVLMATLDEQKRRNDEPRGTARPWVSRPAAQAAILHPNWRGAEDERFRSLASS